MGSTNVAGAQVVVVERLARKRLEVPSADSNSTSRTPPSMRTTALESEQRTSTPVNSGMSATRNFVPGARFCR